MAEIEAMKSKLLKLKAKLDSAEDEEEEERLQSKISELKKKIRKAKADEDSEEEESQKKSKKAKIDSDNEEDVVNDVESSEIDRQNLNMLIELDTVKAADLKKYDALTCGKNPIIQIEKLRQTMENNMNKFFPGIVWSSYIIGVENWYECPRRYTKCPIQPFKATIMQKRSKTGSSSYIRHECLNTELYIPKPYSSADYLRGQKIEYTTDINTYPKQIMNQVTSLFRFPATEAENMCPESLDPNSPLTVKLQNIKLAHYYICRLIKNEKKIKDLDSKEEYVRGQSEESIKYPCILTFHAMPPPATEDYVRSSFNNDGCFFPNHYHLLIGKPAPIAAADDKIKVAKGKSFEECGVIKRRHIDTNSFAHIFIHHAQKHPKKQVVGVTNDAFFSLFKYAVKEMQQILTDCPQADITYRCPSGKEYDSIEVVEPEEQGCFADFGIHGCEEEAGGNVISDDIIARIGDGDDTVNVSKLKFVSPIAQNDTSGGGSKQIRTIFDFHRSLSGAGKKRSFAELTLQGCYDLIKPRYNSIINIKDQIRLNKKMTNDLKHMYLSLFENRFYANVVEDYNRYYWKLHLELGPWNCVLKFLEYNIDIIDDDFFFQDFFEWFTNLSAINNEFDSLYDAMEIILSVYSKKSKRQNTLYIFGKTGLGKTRVFYNALELILYPVNLLGTLTGNHCFQEAVVPALLTVGDDLKPILRDDMLAKMKAFLGGQPFKINPKNKDAIMWTPTPVIWLSNQKWFSFPYNVNLSKSSFNEAQSVEENYVLHNAALKERCVVKILKNPLYKVENINWWSNVWCVLFLFYSLYEADNVITFKESVSFYCFIKKRIVITTPTGKQVNTLLFRNCLQEARSKLSQSINEELRNRANSSEHSAKIRIGEEKSISIKSINSEIDNSDTCSSRSYY